MRRASLLATLVTVVAALVITSVSTGQRSIAQDANPATGTAAHPLVGTWVVGDAGTEVSLYNQQLICTFFADGNLYVTAYAGERPSVWHGVWEPTGDRSADQRAMTISLDASGAPTGIQFLDLTITVADDGQTFTAAGEVTRYDNGGTDLGGGPVQVTGVRLTVTSALPATPTS